MEGHLSEKEGCLRVTWYWRARYEGGSPEGETGGRSSEEEGLPGGRKRKGMDT